jgi:hypothetical protein
VKKETIRVGQRLISWDGMLGYVDLNTSGKRVYGPEEEFKVTWLDFDGESETSEYHTLETLKLEGARFGKGLMKWAR